jgi:hypothetical protein
MRGAMKLTIYARFRPEGFFRSREETLEGLFEMRGEAD